MTIKLFGRCINDFGDAIFNEDGVIDLLLSKKSMSIFSDIKNSDMVTQLDILKYTIPDEECSEYHKRKSHETTIPNEYKNIDIRSFCLEKCETQQEINRINLECDIISSRDMDDFFRCMIYLVDVMRKNNVVWGVGRGSSVASYTLYKIGIHKIDSIKYDIDHNEFFKE